MTDVLLRFKKITDMGENSVVQVGDGGGGLGSWGHGWRSW